MGLIQTGPGSPLAFGPTSGGKVTPVNNLAAVWVLVVAANPNRQSITFHNPGTNTMYIGMMTTVVGSQLNPTLAALGGTFSLLPGATMTFTGECQLAWGAIAATGSQNPLTVMESNV